MDARFNFQSNKLDNIDTIKIFHLTIIKRFIYRKALIFTPVTLQ